ncbi:hypothetical protein GQ44DRAFT_609998 [Phaeosphaeriaceae sp. PMI808]|nr:hypothetical protein GQ44DRAFT_609998 [Phaeosphaeriaceae sp. PMI808]
MEGLAGVASGMAVVSLSIQLIESVDKARTLILNVKEAPSELERLAMLLARLGAVLQEVRNLLEKQASQPKPFPEASPVIVVCLESCENTLKPLDELLQKFQKTPEGSAIAQLRKDVKVALKTKDIAAFEKRIRHEIEYLHMALTTNANIIL